ncbi:MAG: tRNA-queuosine alpha-mannosyltransferase domain-containing protein [Planctomycetota bacterium]|jgi:glycosyltransferase involved in cell wall biosynthesis
MRILALEPYYGGSHKAFLDGWINKSKHNWTLLSLPAYKWKWRMRHSAIHFAEKVTKLISNGDSWDLLFCSDMLNLAEFTGLVPQSIQKLPSIAYFHENQLTYPVRIEDERDYQFAMTNLTTALAATEVWFNSTFHREIFLEALEKLLKQMPDYQPLETIGKIRSKSAIHPPGIEDIQSPSQRESRPIRILWAARWEHDKNPEDFFEALKILKKSGTDFKLSCIGQQFRDVPEIFNRAKAYFGEHIDRWGFIESCEEYIKTLQQADVIVSTANHEFFGITILEAISAGCFPLLPKRLSYPELLGLGKTPGTEQCFYDGRVEDLVNKLQELAEKTTKESLWPDSFSHALLTERFKWDKLTKQYDQILQETIQHDINQL